MSNPMWQLKADANKRLPESLTQIAIDGIMSLPDNGFDIMYLKSLFLSKFVSDDTDPAGLRQMRAIRKWLSIEAQNDATSTRILTYPAYHNIMPGVTRGEFEETVQGFIHDVIGDTPDWPSLSGGFSGGASTSRKRGKSFPSMKYLGEAHVTPTAHDLTKEILGESHVWSDLFDSSGSFITEVAGNVMFTVPKSTEIDRCACKEPDLNMYIQRGIGTQIRQSLRRVGINLNDQSINQRLAQKGSLDGSLATLDLSSASDTVTLDVISLLFPPLWVSLMSQVRSSVTWIPEMSSWLKDDDGKYSRSEKSEPGYWHKTNMLSSMGNGFTFEVESLLFYALARACAYHGGIRGQISVYGDDIIVPTAVASYLIYVLEFYGFSVNTEKSFWSGAFRESCGGHYINGFDVSPFYLRKPLGTLVDLINFLNQMRAWACRGSIGVILEPLWLELAAYVPDSLKGGHDCDNPFILAGPIRGSVEKKLVPIQIRGAQHAGQYLQWLDVRSRIDAVGSSHQVDATTTSKCRLRNRGYWDKCQHCIHLFWGEVSEATSVLNIKS